MKFIAGKVIDGKVVLEGMALEEGAIVTVVSAERGETFTVPLQEEGELVDAMSEIDQGDFVDGDDFLNGLHRST